MVVAATLVLIGASTSEDNSDRKPYFILSLDSGQHKGFMTAKFVSFMEERAYNIARRIKCIEKRTSERMSMTELYDLIAGSETGGIIATLLVVPLSTEDKTNRYLLDKNALDALDEHTYLY